MLVWFHHHLKFLGKECKPEKGEAVRCGCNNLVSSSQNISQLEKYFCPYWPHNCRSYVGNDVLEITKDILINNNNNLQSFPCDYKAAMESPVDDTYDRDNIVTEEGDLNSSSLVLIIPSSSQSQKSEAKHKTKVYSVASLKSPKLVLTLLRGKNKGIDQQETKNQALIESDVFKSSTKLMRKISHYNQRLYKEEPLLHCRRLQCLQSEVTVNGHHICGDFILKNI